jgi:hypothetical protein
MTGKNKSGDHEWQSIITSINNNIITTIVAIVIVILMTIDIVIITVVMFHRHRHNHCRCRLNCKDSVSNVSNTRYERLSGNEGLPKLALLIGKMMVVCLWFPDKAQLMYT